MKFKNVFAIFFLLCLTQQLLFGQAKSTIKDLKLIQILKDKKGNILGKVYIFDFKYDNYYKADIFNSLIVVKENKSKTDTLYFINKYVLKNSKGLDITVSKSNFHGYKMERNNGDSFQMFMIAGNGEGASDPITVEWNYTKKLFQVRQEE